MQAYKINSIESLCEFIEVQKPNMNQINELLWITGVKAILLEEGSIEEYSTRIKEFWHKWKHTKERPIFMGIDIDVK